MTYDPGAFPGGGVTPLPWAPSFGWLTGRQCRARLTRRESSSGRYGRCELVAGHTGSSDSTAVDHALEWGMETLRWPRSWPYAEGAR